MIQEIQGVKTKKKNTVQEKEKTGNERLENERLELLKEYRKACDEDLGFEFTDFKEQEKNILSNKTESYPILDTITAKRLYDLNDRLKKELLTLKLRNLTRKACDNKNLVSNNSRSVYEEIDPSFLKYLDECMLSTDELNTEEFSKIVNKYFNNYANAIVRLSCPILNMIKLGSSYKPLTEYIEKNEVMYRLLGSNSYSLALDKGENSILINLLNELKKLAHTKTNTEFSNNQNEIIKKAMLDIKNLPISENENLIQENIKTDVHSLFEDLKKQKLMHATAAKHDSSKILNLKSKDFNNLNYKKAALSMIALNIFDSSQTLKKTLKKFDTNRHKKKMNEKTSKINTIINKDFSQSVYNSSEEEGFVQQQLPNDAPVFYNNDEIQKTRYDNKKSYIDFKNANLNLLYNIYEKISDTLGNSEKEQQFDIRAILKQALTFSGALSTATALNVFKKALTHQKHSKDKSLKVLILCSGYGALPIAALEIFKNFDKLYDKDSAIVCIDSNPSLFNGYKQATKELELENNVLECMHATIDENFKNKFIENNSDKFDIIVSCPPYFNKEEYNGSVQGKIYEAWKDNFLKPFSEIIHNCLKKEKGIAAIIIGSHCYNGTSYNPPLDLEKMMEESEAKVYCSKKTSKESTREVCLFFTKNKELLNHKEHLNDKYKTRVEEKRDSFFKKPKTNFKEDLEEETKEKIVKKKKLNTELAINTVETKVSDEKALQKTKKKSTLDEKTPNNTLKNKVSKKQR